MKVCDVSSVVLSFHGHAPLDLGLGARVQHFGSNFHFLKIKVFSKMKVFLKGEKVNISIFKHDHLTPSPYKTLSFTSSFEFVLLGLFRYRNPYIKYHNLRLNVLYQC